ncbi:hypothetical protein J4E83_002865 [Alternaria metachromatica]|uniref:uncharacterized protein n=1 Tax=Alternaria metachromatica TaxID=283354 RepID=UPI0020C57839|nr:uncharacterized protein J4E83_002865 [Alternaria metachromatica]KAI4631334.1 hypothetical protein J4E83_002865 [Alternaria metachromatica]
MAATFHLFSKFAVRKSGLRSVTCVRQKTDPLPSHPHNMPPKNTPQKNASNAGYSSEHSPDEPDQDVLSDFEEESSSSSSESPPKEKRVTTSEGEGEDDDVVAVSKDSTPSPTASTILIRFELEDTLLAGKMNEKWKKGLSDAERAKKLQELLDKCTAKREEGGRAAVEEMKRRMEEDDEEEQYEGKGKGKQV